MFNPFVNKEKLRLYQKVYDFCTREWGVDLSHTRPIIEAKYVMGQPLSGQYDYDTGKVTVHEYLHNWVFVFTTAHELYHAKQGVDGRMEVKPLGDDPAPRLWWMGDYTQTVGSQSLQASLTEYVHLPWEKEANDMALQTILKMISHGYLADYNISAVEVQHVYDTLYSIGRFPEYFFEREHN